MILPTTSGSSAYDDITNGTSVQTANNISYTLTWLVTESTAPAHKVIKVTVTWTDSTNQTQSMVLESIVGKVDVKKSGLYMQSL